MKSALKKSILALCLALAATAVWASCRYYTVTINGKTYYCTECCYYGVCNTNCN